MDLTSFLKKNVKAVEDVKYVASQRFTDEKGKPVEWVLKAVGSDTDELIRKDCTKKVPIVGKRGQFNLETDNEKYLNRLATESTVFPNLDDAELQDSWGVSSAEELLKKMLSLPMEYTNYKTKVLEVNGFDISFEDEVEEAKN